MLCIATKELCIATKELCIAAKMLCTPPEMLCICGKVLRGAAEEVVSPLRVPSAGSSLK